MDSFFEFRNGASPRDFSIREDLKSFSRIPFLKEAVDYGMKLIFFEGSLTDNPEVLDLKGVVPINWGKSSWDKSAGLYRPNLKLAFVGTRGNYESVGDVAVHELGHGLDRCVGKLIYGKNLSEIEEIRYILEKESPRIDYFNLPREFIADGFDNFYKSSETRKNLKKKFPMRFKFFSDLEKNYLDNFSK